MKRSEAKRKLSRKFEFKQGKGDHWHFYRNGVLVYGLASGGKSNGSDLPRSESRKVLKLLEGES